MPYKDPEKQREFERNYAQRPEVRARKIARNFIAAHAPGKPLIDRAYYRANAGHIIARSTAKYVGRISVQEASLWIALRDDPAATCDICGRTRPGTRFAIDHDHETGAVRGILCLACNGKLSGLETPFIKPALSYLFRRQSI